MPATPETCPDARPTCPIPNGSPNWGRFGLLKPSFIPPEDLRELRWQFRAIAKKQTQILAGEKNRLHKILDDAGIKLGAVVSNIDGVSARAIIEGLIDGVPAEQLPELAKGTLHNKKEILELCLDGELSPRQLARIHGNDRVGILGRKFTCPEKFPAGYGIFWNRQIALGYMTFLMYTKLQKVQDGRKPKNPARIRGACRTDLPSPQRTELSSRRIARVLFCVHEGRLVALHGFIKKTPNTPDQELKKARKRQKKIET